MNTCKCYLSITTKPQYGFSLVELMVALGIGLFLLGGMIQLLISTKQSYRLNEALSRIQESGRFATEFLSHDMRMTGFSGCPRKNTITNLLANASTVWWKNFGAGTVVGYDGGQAFPGKNFGTSPEDRVNGTDAVIFLQGGGNDYSIASHSPTTAPPQFTLNNSPGNNLKTGSIVMVCDAEHTSILQLTNVTDVTLQYSGTITSPFKAASSSMVDYIPTAFYIGVGTSGGTSRSLYRLRLDVVSSTPTIVADELVEGVENMQIYYRTDLAYADASAVINWTQVSTVRVNLLLASLEDQLNLAPQLIIFPVSDTGYANTSGNSFTASDRRLYQVFSTTAALRNKLP